MPDVPRAEVLGVVELYQQLPPALQVPHVNVSSRSGLRIPDDVILGILAPRGLAPLPPGSVPRVPDRTIFAPSVWTAPDGRVLHFSAMYVWRSGGAHIGFRSSKADPLFFLSVYAVITDAYCHAAAVEWLRANADTFAFQNYPAFFEQNVVGESPLNLVRWFGISSFVKIFFAALAGKSVCLYSTRPAVMAKSIVFLASVFEPFAPHILLYASAAHMPNMDDLPQAFCGFHVRENFRRSFDTHPNDPRFIYFDMDAGTFLSAPSAFAPMPPPEVSSRLLKDLISLSREVHTFSPKVNELLLSREQNTELTMEHIGFSMAVARSLVMLFEKYRCFVLYPGVSLNLPRVFARDLFIQSSPENARKYLEKVTQQKFFELFIARLPFPCGNMFDSFCYFRISDMDFRAFLSPAWKRIILTFDTRQPLDCNTCAQFFESSRQTPYTIDDIVPVVFSSLPDLQQLVHVSEPIKSCYLRYMLFFDGIQPDGEDITLASTVEENDYPIFLKSLLSFLEKGTSCQEKLDKVTDFTAFFCDAYDRMSARKDPFGISMCFNVILALFHANIRQGDEVAEKLKTNQSFMNDLVLSLVPYTNKMVEKPLSAMKSDDRRALCYSGSVDEKSYLKTVNSTQNAESGAIVETFKTGVQTMREMKLHKEYASKYGTAFSKYFVFSKKRSLLSQYAKKLHADPHADLDEDTFKSNIIKVCNTGDVVGMILKRSNEPAKTVYKADQGIIRKKTHAAKLNMSDSSRMMFDKVSALGSMFMLRPVPASPQSVTNSQTSESKKKKKKPHNKLPKKRSASVSGNVLKDLVLLKDVRSEKPKQNDLPNCLTELPGAKTAADGTVKAIPSLKSLINMPIPPVKSQPSVFDVDWSDSDSDTAETPPTFARPPPTISRTESGRLPRVNSMRRPLFSADTREIQRDLPGGVVDDSEPSFTSPKMRTYLDERYAQLLCPVAIPIATDQASSEGEFDDDF